MPAQSRAPMVDMHSHILPGVDDGAGSLDDAFALLQLAVEDGVSLQILTPHLQPGRYDNTRQSLEQQFIEFQFAVMRAQIPIELYLAAEVRISHDLMRMVEHDELPWLGERNGDRTFLLEFPQNEIPLGSENLVRWLRQQNVLPIIAHPERNLTFQKSPGKLRPLLEMGCLLQVTAGSLTGHFGQKARRLASTLVREGHATLLATDCHNLEYRPPNLAQGVEAAARLIGERDAMKMVSDNVFELMAGEQHRA